MIFIDIPHLLLSPCLLAGWLLRQCARSRTSAWRLWQLWRSRRKLSMRQRLNGPSAPRVSGDFMIMGDLQNLVMTNIAMVFRWP